MRISAISEGMKIYCWEDFVEESVRGGVVQICAESLADARRRAVQLLPEKCFKVQEVGWHILNDEPDRILPCALSFITRLDDIK